MLLSAVKAIRKRQLNCIKGLENSKWQIDKLHQTISSERRSYSLRTCNQVAVTYSRKRNSLR